jgi:hypothetical protein
MARSEAPEFALLDAAGKRLVRRLGMTDNHLITAANGVPGAGWNSLEDCGWIRMTTFRIGGYEIGFTLSGWEWWCRQCDAEDGMPLQDTIFG